MVGSRVWMHVRRNAVAYVALFFALSAGAYAAEIKANSVGSKQIRSGAVKSSEIHDRSVKLADVSQSSLGRHFAGKGDQQPIAAELTGGDHSECYWTRLSDPEQFWSAPEYFRDAAGVVHLRGVVTAHDGDASSCGGGDGVIYSLPAGYRPEKTAIFAIVAADAPGRANVNPDGSVNIENNFPTWTQAKQWVSLDGIDFRCAPSGVDGCP